MTTLAPPGAPLAPHGLAQGVAALAQRDADLAAVPALAGMPCFALRPPGFATLLHIILEQQVSVAAAAAMRAKLLQRCRPLTPGRFLALDDATLRECGFSRQKTAYARGLAEAIRDGRFDPKALARRDDEAAMAELTGLRGIGRWTAEVYLLFALGRADVWPAADLGLQLGVQWLKRLPARPDERAMRALAEPWRPWRAVAACLLWQFYLHRLGRLPPPAAAAPEPLTV
jgi:DNA-3-methyladenine glycosylase II